MLGLAGRPGAAAAAVTPSGFAVEKVKGGLNTPTAVAFAPDGRIFYLEKGAANVGKIRIIQNGAILEQPFVTITNLAAGFEVGMLGLALDPNFASNHYVYLYYTQDDQSGGVEIEPTFDSIQTNVFNAACLGCHGVEPGAGLSLLPADSYAALVNAASTEIPSMKRVKPGDPDNSYLVWKLEDHPGIVGDRMPPGGPPLDEATIDAIREWIANGAPAAAPPPAAVADKALPLGEDARNRVVRYTDVNNRGEDVAVILDYIPAAGFHNAGVLEFAPDGTLFIQTGENGGDGMLAQDGNSLGGKVLRINKDGTIPADNPFVSDPDVRDEVFTLGHRNGFGLAPDRINPFPLRVYVSENGPTFADEINLAAAGLNFGWPMNQGVEGCAQFACPIFTWSPTVAPTGIERYNGSRYPNFTGNLFVGHYNRDLGEAVIQRLTLNAAGTQVTADTVFYQAFLGPNGYVLDVLQGPDGYLYFTTGDALFRFTRDSDHDGCSDAKDPKPANFSADADGDGFGKDCDCEDGNAFAHPGMPELEGNGVNDDCDNSTPPPGSCPGPTTLDPGARPDFFGWANAALYLLPAAFLLWRQRRGRAA